jgi:formylglycine-generating enzyme required for sulfatase activity
VALAREIADSPELLILEREVDKKIAELNERAAMEREETVRGEEKAVEEEGEVEYLKLKEKPSYIRAIEAKAEKVYKNKSGYWEAVFFNDTAMVYIPAGNFRMGLNAGDPDQRPGHDVYLDGYWMAKNEVTFEQFDRFCKDSGEKKPRDRGWGRGRRPVICISWRSAQNYCEWLSKKSGLKFVLPTEAQWEKAARDTTGRLYPWGDRAPDNVTANYRNEGDGSDFTAVVGSYPVGDSSYGISDLAGNVREWCRDWYDEGYYAVSPAQNPEGPLRGSARVARGGSWNNGKRYIRSTHRVRSSPSSRDHYTGFRIVLEFAR